MKKIEKNIVIFHFLGIIRLCVYEQRKGEVLS